jgi:hypothetical protein
LHLGADASAFLWERVRLLVADVERHALIQAGMALGRSRAQRNQYIKTLSSCLSRLENHLADRDRNTDEILRAQLSRLLGEIVSHRGFERLVEISPGYGVGSRFPPARIGARDDGLYEALEDEMQQRRENLARQRVPSLLSRFVHELNHPLVRFLAIERQNKGGVPGKLYRNYFIENLVPVYKEIYRMAPRPTASGEFVTLCDWVLGAIGLETDGLDQAVGRILRRLKAG